MQSSIIQNFWMYLLTVKFYDIVLYVRMNNQSSENVMILVAHTHSHQYNVQLLYGMRVFKQCGEKIVLLYWLVLIYQPVN